MKASTTKPEDLGVHNASAQNNDSQQAWSMKSPVPVTSSSSSGPVLVEIENLPQSSAADQHDRKRLSATSDRCQRGGNQWNPRALPPPQTAYRNYTDFVHEHNVKNAGAHHDAHLAGRAAMTDI